MLREHDSVLRQFVAVIDTILVIFSFFVAYQLRINVESWGLVEEGVWRPLAPLSEYFSVLPFLVLPWVAALIFVGSYRPIRESGLKRMLWSIISAGFVALLIFSAFAFFLRFYETSRFVIGSFFILTWLILSLQRLILVLFLYYIRAKGHNTRYMLIIGTGPRAISFIEKIHEHPEWGFQIHGLFDRDPDLIGREILGHRVLGLLEDLPVFLERMIVDEVVFVVPRDWLGHIEEAILYCEKLGKRVNIAVDLYTLEIAKAKQGSFHGVPILTFQSTPAKAGQLAIKRVLDICISINAIIALLPVYIGISLLIRSVSKGPAIFKQKRCGLNGRVFTLYKFRTMIVNAEAKLEELRKQNEMTGPAFKLKDDPRLIKFGKILRKFSIDEFPQFFNVLKGDMSIVGPRPPIPAEVRKYETWQRRRLSMRPGLTCNWQVEGRNRITKFEEWMKLDLLYIDTWSLWADVKLFIKTIPIVIFGIGAK